MAEDATFKTLTSVLREVLDNDDVVATAGLTAGQVAGWDSLTNVRLFIQIESTFGVRFSAAEISSLKNVGQLADRIERKVHSGNS